MNEKANYVRTQPPWCWHMLWLLSLKTCLLDQKLLFFCSGKLGGGGVKVSHRWNVTSLNNFLAEDLLNLHTVIWFGLEIWIEIVEYAFWWLQGTGVKPPSLDIGCRWFPRPAEWSRSKFCAMVWEVWSTWMPCVYVSLGGGLESWCALAAPDTALPEAAAAGHCKQIASPCCCTASGMLAATSWTQACWDPSKWSPCPEYMHVFLFSLCGWNSVPSSTVGCPCVTCFEMFSCLQHCHLYFGLILGATELNTTRAVEKPGSAFMAKSLYIQLRMWYSCQNLHVS